MNDSVTTLLGIALWALIPGFIAWRKGRNFAVYYFLSFLITPLITLIITICLPKSVTTDDAQTNSNTSANIENEVKESFPGERLENENESLSTDPSAKDFNKKTKLRASDLCLLCIFFVVLAALTICIIMFFNE